MENTMTQFMKSALLASLLLANFALLAQQNIQQTLNFEWSEKRIKLSELEPELLVPSFPEAVFPAEAPRVAHFVQTFELSAYSQVEARLANEQWEALPNTPSPDVVADIPPDIQLQANVAMARKQAMLTIKFAPLRKNAVTNQVERLVSADLQVLVRPYDQNTSTAITRNPINSVLSDGQIYRLKVTESGIYRLDYNYLRDLGINVDNLNPSHIKIYGNGGKMMPELNSAPRIDDLAELAIRVDGQADGKFDNSDQVLFYAEGPDLWVYDSTNAFYSRVMHAYSNENYYFLKISSTPGKRIGNAAPTTASQYSTTFDAAVHYENNIRNLHDDYLSYPGSGRVWLGETYKFTGSQNFNLTLPGLQTTGNQVKMLTTLSARSIGSASNFVMKYNGNNLFTRTLSSVSGATYATYAAYTPVRMSFNATGEQINLDLAFNQAVGSAEGWLDYITLNGRCLLNVPAFNGQMPFRDFNALTRSVYGYELQGENLSVWDITDHHNVQSYALSNNRFAAPGLTLREFIAFDGNRYLTPAEGKAIANQNLHASAVPNMLLVYHPEFEQAAAKLRDHRQAFSQLNVLMVSTEQVYNEYASGKADPTAIRDFVRQLYNRDTNDDFQYLLLFGDGTFDYRSYSYKNNNTNFVPTYQTPESFNPIGSYTTDDYFALLDTMEGSVSGGLLDIAVGRFPVRNSTEAMEAVDKMIKYEKNPVTFQDWKNRVTFMADDEDGNLHIGDADGIAQYVFNNYKLYNINKIYLDAFQQQSAAGGNRYPAVNQAILNDLFQGTFVFCFLGHGGETGLCQERVFTESEISILNNSDYLPLFVTATCAFAPYDNPGITSAGESLFLNPDGGAIALLTTTRVVYASANERLTRSIFEGIFEPTADLRPARLGIIMTNGKNSLGTGDIANTRKFSHLGDPAMRLAYPFFDVSTDSIFNAYTDDTTKVFEALKKVTVYGHITNKDGSLKKDFNGTIYPTVFDKVATKRTLGNDPGSPQRNFNLQKNIIFKGRASVVNGAFSFTFIVPKDINYTLGYGKISYYAEDGFTQEAADYYDEILVGGAYANAVDDNQPPVVQVFMNDENFALGGITDANPVLYAKLSDDSGINTTGNSIGHDITGVLDGDDRNIIVLNNYYQSALNDFTSGELHYQLSKLSEGLHTIRVKAWDIHNNPGEGYTEFVVASTANIALEHVLNYPNPFTTSTNFQFEHNFPGQDLEVQVQIFSVSGKLVKTINQDVFTSGFRVDDISWDGTDDYGDRIGRGVYVYRVSVRVNLPDGTKSANSNFEKLVILK
jgi:hypothetical protein